MLMCKKESEVSVEALSVIPFSMTAVLQVLISMCHTSRIFRISVYQAVHELLFYPNSPKLLESTIRDTINCGLFTVLINRSLLQQTKNILEKGDGPLFGMLPPRGTIHSIIFQHMDHKNLVSCAAVCRRWFRVSREASFAMLLYYSNLSFGSVNIIDILADYSASPNGAFEVFFKSKYYCCNRFT